MIINDSLQITRDIVQYLSRSANPFEWLITIVGFSTMGVTFRIWRRSVSRKRAWKAAGLNGTVLKQINGNIEVALFNLGIQELLTAWGITLMLTMPTNPHAPVTSTGIVNAFVIVLVELGMSIKLVRLNRRQIRIAAEIREREEMGFTGPIPVVGFDAYIEAARRLLNWALQLQEAAKAQETAATEMGNAAVQVLSLMQGNQARAARKQTEAQRGNQADQYAKEGEQG